MVVNGAIVQDGNAICCVVYFVLYILDNFSFWRWFEAAVLCVARKGPPHSFGKALSQKRKFKVAFRFLRKVKPRLSSISEGFVNR